MSPYYLMIGPLKYLIVGTMYIHLENIFQYKYWALLHGNKTYLLLNHSSILHQLIIHSVYFSSIHVHSSSSKSLHIILTFPPHFPTHSITFVNSYEVPGHNYATISYVSSGESKSSLSPISEFKNPSFYFIRHLTSCFLIFNICQQKNGQAVPGQFH